MKESKGLYLLKNISYLTIGQLATKVLMFILLPLYTSILSPEEYGIFDLYISTVTLLMPIFTFNISEAVLRFSVDVDDNDNVFTNGLKIILLSCCFCILFLAINNICGFFPLIQKHEYIFFIMYIFTVLLEVIVNFARGIDKIACVAISGFVGSTITILFNIFFLVFLKYKLNGFFIAYILGLMGQIIYLGFSFRIFRYINLYKAKPKELIEMLRYSIPLIWNSLAWWLNDVSSRYIITFFLGVYETGIYSAATRIPAILAILQSIFNKAWVVSAIKDFESNESVQFFSNVYKIYNAFMVVICSILILANKFIAYMLFSGNFYEAWKYSPFLLLSLVFSALSGFLGGIFAAKKATGVYSYSSTIGAIINVFFCFFLITKIGTLGASIAALLSSVVIWGFRYYCVQKYIKLKANHRNNTIAYLLLLIQVYIMIYVDKNIILYTTQIIILSLICVVYRGVFISIIKISKDKFKRKGLPI